MKSSAVTANSNATAQQYNDLRADAYGSSMLLVHQEATPGMTVYVEPGVFYLGPTKVSFAGGSSPTITAPTANPRIDLLTLDSSGTLAWVTGTEAASPTAPTYPVDKMVLAEVYNVSGETIIYDNANQTAGQGYITDVRPFLVNPAPTITDNSSKAVGTVYQNTSGRFELHMLTITLTGGNGTTGGNARLTINSDASSSPVTVVAEAFINAILPADSETSVEQQVTFMVPPGYYYQAYGYASGGSVGSVVAWQTIAF